MCSSHRKDALGITDDSRKVLLEAIIQVFRAPMMTGNSQLNEIFIFQHIQKSLATVFRNKDLVW